MRFDSAIMGLWQENQVVDGEKRVAERLHERRLKCQCGDGGLLGIDLSALVFSCGMLSLFSASNLSLISVMFRQL